MRLFTKEIYSFDENIWKNHLNKRKNYLTFLLEDVWIISKTKEQVFFFLGDEGNQFSSDRWTYYIGKSIWLQDIYITLYFEENEVDRVVVERTK